MCGGRCSVRQSSDRVSDFKPPPLSFSTELRWVLRAAFADSSAPTCPLDGAGVVELCRKLDVSGRIAGRVAPRALVAAVGEAPARHMTQHRLAVVAGNRSLMQGLQRLLTIAPWPAAPVAPLKFAALMAAGILAEGDRDARDLDLLVRENDAARLWTALVSAGYEPLGSAKLAPLYGPQRELIELKTNITGLVVRDASGRKVVATFDALFPLAASAGHESHARSGTNVYRIERPVLAAHLLVHALVQHANAGTYPAFRALCDVADLLRSGELSIDAVLESVPDSAQATVRAAIQLTKGLIQGAAPESWPPSALERRILAHLIGSSCDDDYRNVLRLRRARELQRSRRLIPKLIEAVSRPGGVNGLAHDAVRTAEALLHAQRVRRF